MAAESVEPPSTEARVAVSTFWNILFSCWFGQNFQALHQRQTGVNHHRELAGEDREVFGVNSAAESGHVELFALLRHFADLDLLALEQA